MNSTVIHTLITHSNPCPFLCTHVNTHHPPHLHCFVAVIEEDRQESKNLSSRDVIVVSQHGHNLKGKVVSTTGTCAAANMKALKC